MKKIKYPVLAKEELKITSTTFKDAVFIALNRRPDGIHILLNGSHHIFELPELEAF